MVIKNYFFDTYVFHELALGNPNYAKFNSVVNVLTCKLNLMELYYTFLCKYGKDIAEVHYDKFTKCCIDIDDEIIKKAMDFKQEHKKRNLSYVDCIGYILAIHKGLIFVTGDKEFEHFPNVEFVK